MPTNKEPWELYPQLFCQECLKDPEIKCKRDKDVKCIHCGAELCAYHMNKHLEEKHLISTTWKGMGVEPAKPFVIPKPT